MSKVEYTTGASPGLFLIRPNGSVAMHIEIEQTPSTRDRLFLHNCEGTAFDRGQIETLVCIATHWLETGELPGPPETAKEKALRLFDTMWPTWKETSREDLLYQVGAAIEAIL